MNYCVVYKADENCTFIGRARNRARCEGLRNVALELLREKGIWPADARVSVVEADTADDAIFAVPHLFPDGVTVHAIDVELGEEAIDILDEPPAPNFKGRRRNELCPCGSGEKAKKCCGAA